MPNCFFGADSVVFVSIGIGGRCRLGIVIVIIGVLACTEHAAVVLKRHILDLDLEKFAVALTEGEHAVGGLGVYMQLDNAAGLEGDNTVSDTAQPLGERLDTERLGIGLASLQAQQQLGAVAVLKLAVFVEAVEIRLGGGRCSVLPRGIDESPPGCCPRAVHRAFPPLCISVPRRRSQRLPRALGPAAYQVCARVFF